MTTRRCRDDLKYSWDLTPKEAVAQQKQLASRVRIEPFDPSTVRFVAGLDVSFPGAWGSRKTPVQALAAAVIYDIANDALSEKTTAVGEVKMPYIPGLLSFRECPLIIEALKKLRGRVDILMVDGQGIAHPRRFGIASHLGLFTGRRTFGCAKSILVGEVEGSLGEEAGSWCRLVDRSETVGAAVRTRTGVKPVYVSPGHLCNLDSIIGLMKRFVGRFRLPEPVRQAHILATQMRGNVYNDVGGT